MKIKNLEKRVVETTLRAAEHVRNNAYNMEKISWKKPGDPVTNLDIEAEQMFKDEFGNEVNYHCEELGEIDNAQDITLIGDGIDGTKSAVNKEFMSAISVALKRDNTLIAGAIADFMRNTYYFAFEGSKPYMVVNDQRMDMQHPHLMDKVRIAVDDRINIDHPKVKNRHQTGSIALTMAHVAAGIYDGIICEPRKGATWDIAAGIYLMQEKGLQLTTFDGRPYQLNEHINDGLIATNQKAQFVRDHLA